MEKTLLSIGLACLMMAFAINCDAQTTFKPYKRTAGATCPGGGSAGLTLKFDIPVGEGPRQTKINNGIREIIRQSMVIEEMKRPVTGPIRNVANSLATYFPTGIRKGTIDVGCSVSFELLIEKAYQNSYAVFFHVTDGVYSNGGPSESYKIVRVSDGKVMGEQEVFNVKFEDLVRLIKKYGTAEQKDFDESFLMDEVYLCPAAGRCKVQYLYGMHDWETLDVPSSEIEGFLTEEGRKCFGK